MRVVEVFGIGLVETLNSNLTSIHGSVRRVFVKHHSQSTPLKVPSPKREIYLTASLGIDISPWVQVLNNSVLWILVIVIVVQVFSKYMIVGYLDP